DHRLGGPVGSGGLAQFRSGLRSNSHRMVGEFRASLAGPAPNIWRSLLPHVEVLSDGLGGFFPLAQASALAGCPFQGRYFFLLAGSLGLRSYGSGDGPSEEDRGPSEG